MSLIRSKRPDLFGGSPVTVGPGSYDPNIPNFKPKHGVAPFGCTSERNTLMTSMTPGPGTYDPSLEVHQGPSFRTLSSQFASREPRLAKMIDNEVPGPGAYTPEFTPDTKSSNARRSMHSGSGINWVKIATAPSIPAAAQSYGYREGGHGELVQQPVPHAGFTGTGDDRPGPGHYNAADSKFYKKNDLRHVMDFGKRSGRPDQRVKLVVPGPGSYNADKIGSSPILRGGVMATRETSQFASTTTRAPLQVTSYGPGPGTYKPASSFKSLREHLANNPDTFHAFGICSSNPRPEPKKLEVPGPGTYTQPLVPQPPTDPDGAAHSAAFASKSDRFYQRLEAVPGPGAYPTNGLAEKLKAVHPPVFGAFGSTSARLPVDPPPSAPPIGSYDPRSSNTAELRRKDKRSPAFRASTKTQDPSFTTQGAQVQYDVKYDWPKPTSTQANLGGTERRFINLSKEAVPGPGHYPSKNMLSEQSRTTANGTGMTWSKSRRFDQNASEVPGPGTYQAGAGSLLKKSFNITIGDAWE